MYKKIAGLFLVMMLLTSCTNFSFSTEDLMQPPRLTPEQEEITHALINAAGTDDITFKYPKGGSYRSSFVFHNLDDDAEDEAIVFYQVGSMSTGTRIEILDKRDGVWQSVFCIPGIGEDVDFISFANITNLNRQDILVGWSFPVGSDKKLAVYQYDGEVIDTNFSESYHDFVVLDSNSDGLQEIILLQHGQSYEGANARLVSLSEGRLMVTDTIALSEDAVALEQVLVGQVAEDQLAVFIDQRLNGGEYVTDVVQVDGQHLRDLLKPNDADDEERTLAPEQDRTQREVRVLCGDVDGDQIVEVPTADLMPGYKRDKENRDPIYMTHFNHLEDGYLYPAFTAAVNVENGYMIKMPRPWVGKVTVVSQPETGEWRFFRYNGSLAEQNDVLLRVRVYSQSDYHDKFEEETFELLEKKGLFEYYGYIPKNSSQDLAITWTDLKEMFQLLN